MLAIICEKWGYEEWESEGKRNVRILPLEVIDSSIWSKHLNILKKDFPSWRFI